MIKSISKRSFHSVCTLLGASISLTVLSSPSFAQPPFSPPADQQTELRIFPETPKHELTCFQNGKQLFVQHDVGEIRETYARKPYHLVLIDYRAADGKWWSINVDNTTTCITSDT